MSFFKKKRLKDANDRVRDDVNDPIAPLWKIPKLIKEILKKILGAMMLSIVIEIVGMSLIWKDNPYHAQEMLITNINYLGNFTQSSIGLPPRETAIRVVTFVKQYLNVSDMAQTLLGTPQAYTFKMNLYQIIEGLQHYFDAIIYIILDIIVRCLIIVLSIGVFVLFAVVGIADGSVERELRYEGAGDDHGFVFHKIKRFIPHVLWITPYLYLAYPDAINPNYIILPGACLLGLGMYLYASKFMKRI